MGGDTGESFQGAKESNKDYLSSTLNNSTSKFYPITVTNTGASISLKTATGGTAHVVTSGGLYNLMARDIIVNNKDRNAATEIASSSYAVIHQVDQVLNFETTAQVKLRKLKRK